MYFMQGMMGFRNIVDTQEIFTDANKSTGYGLTDTSVRLSYTIYGRGQMSEYENWTVLPALQIHSR